MNKRKKEIMTNIILTTSEKIEIVKLSLDILTKENNDKNKDVHFMCVAIEKAYSILGYNEDEKSIKGIDIIPELLKYKPKDIVNINSAWFSDWKNKQPRIDILNNVIEELNNKLNNEQSNKN